MQAKQTLDRKEAQQYLNKFSFQHFFTELMGWNATPATRTIKTVELQEFHFTTIAEKRGYTVLLCDSIPAYPVRAKLDRLISRDHFEHIIVFTDQQTKRQVWQVSLREKGNPVKLREVVYKVGTSNGEELLQKLQQIAVPLALEESTHLTDLTQAARAAFNREKVTKSFFKQFELEHKSFLKFLKGVPKTTEAWYVSVLINRLMFLYFMQSKSFLDANPNYLTDKLQATTARKANSKDTFYRDFLCPLFFEGFALKKESRTPAVKTLLGDIPYLNGGLFQKHAIELQAEADGMRRGNAQPARLEVPPEIAAGLDNVSLRTGWNRPIPADFAEHALPTETWREFIARRRRYDDLRTRIAAGEVHQVNDLITLNLDIRQLALDAIQIAGSEDLVESLYKAIESVTILDPTCGSGAFLFAALELLQPLYQACLLRMQEFVDEAKTEAASKGKELHFNRFAHFRKTLEAAAKHVNIDYFILKTIIVQNLYGVDIMEEATEICKLRLFLKLVAQLDAKQKDKIEPLPDIDFNIRAGNTLVGYARLSDIRGGQGDLYWQSQIERIETDSKDLADLVYRFRVKQTQVDGDITADDKEEVRKRFTEIEGRLDGLLSVQYKVKKADTKTWKTKARPFHWFCDFFTIINDGGFDVILGNPPYVELARLKDSYKIRDFESTITGNLYAPIIEQCYRLLRDKGRFGMIIPMSFSCTERMREIRDVVEEHSSKIWVSHFSGDAHPAKLFEGVKFRLDILLAVAGKGGSIVSSPYMKWFAEARPALFAQIRYFETGPSTRHLSLIPKLELETAPILSKLFERRSMEPSLGRDSRVLYLHRVMTMFIKCFDFVPYFENEADGIKKSDDYKPFQFRSDADADAALALLNSSTFFLYFVTMGDCFHCGRDYVLSFPAGLSDIPRTAKQELSRLGVQLMADLKRNAIRKRAVSEKTGTVQYDEFWPSKSKPLIDEIDRILAKHYGFTDEELDFIINYDIKYRMGADATTPDNDG